MFFLRRPTQAIIDRFLDRSRELPFSYAQAGILEQPPADRRLDEQAVVIGHGDADFRRARAALLTWKHFDLGWVKAFADRPRVEAGTNAAVLIRHLGFWSLNGARVIDCEDPVVSGFSRTSGSSGRSVAFTYGTLTNHAESGEELFDVRVDPQSGDVIYRIRAVSWAQSPLAWVGQPIVRVLQEKFRRDSAVAMTRALAGSGTDD